MLLQTLPVCYAPPSASIERSLMLHLKLKLWDLAFARLACVSTKKNPKIPLHWI